MTKVNIVKSVMIGINLSAIVKNRLGLENSQIVWLLVCIKAFLCIMDFYNCGSNKWRQGNTY
jgi:hypothetical protein